MDETPLESPVKNVKNTAGFLLVGIGVLIALWVFFSVYSLYNNPEELGRFQKIVSGELETRLSGEKENVKLIVPPEVLSYAVPIVLLAIATAVAGTLITGGVALLEGDVRILARKINGLKVLVKERFDGLNEKSRGSRETRSEKENE